jgi:hypothetical protein
MKIEISLMGSLEEVGKTERKWNRSYLRGRSSFDCALVVLWCWSEYRGSAGIVVSYCPRSRAIHCRKAGLPTQNAARPHERERDSNCGGPSPHQWRRSIAESAVAGGRGSWIRVGCCVLLLRELGSGWVWLDGVRFDARFAVWLGLGCRLVDAMADWDFASVSRPRPRWPTSAP